MKDFDFDAVGKKMPYRVTDSYFSESRQHLLRQAEPVRSRRLRPWIFGVGSAAAAVAVVITLALTLARPVDSVRSQATTLSDVTAAFDNLSTGDQDYLLEVYADDDFADDLSEEW